MKTPEPTPIKPAEQRFIPQPDPGNTGYMTAHTELRNGGMDYIRATNVDGGTQLDAWHSKPVGALIEAPFEEMSR